MIVLVCYDVSTQDTSGQRRLRKIAQAAGAYGVRVQYSLFECSVNDAQWVILRDRILRLIDEREDSVRFYFIDERARERTEHHGVRRPLDPQGPLVL